MTDATKGRLGGSHSTKNKQHFLFYDMIRRTVISSKTVHTSTFVCVCVQLILISEPLNISILILVVNPSINIFETDF